MAERDKYKQYLDKYYPIDVNDVLIGKAKLEGQIIQDMPIYLPVKNLNRHGLIAGATGSGKTKTIQLLAEGLSKQGINVLLMDIKGDLSGLAAKGQSNDALAARTKLLNFDFKPSAYPVEFLSISEQVGIRLRG
ncbi:MAG: helicase HerA-like domain-containing protein, partial [Pseudomonadota bacterium]